MYFKPHLEILSEAQNWVYPQLRNLKKHGFVLYGGTAEFLYDQAHGCSLFASDCRQSIEILPTGSRVHSIIRGKPGLGNQSSTRIFASVGR